MHMLSSVSTLPFLFSSNGENVYYSLVDEMKKKDLGMRCLLDDAELLLFTSYQLPLPCWSKSISFFFF